MDNVLLMIITTFILIIVLVIITWGIIKKNQTTKYKKEITELDIEKNKLVGVPILSEISKVKDLVKTDNLKRKLDDWDATFKLIKDDKVPKLNDMISEADFLIDRRDYKQAVKKIASVEIEIKNLEKKSDALLNEIKIITNSEERNRAVITKLKIMYRELQNKYERTEKDYGEVSEYIGKYFDYIDQQFKSFENSMDNNDYVEVEKIVIVIEEQINNLKELLDKLPSIVLMSTVLIPNKIEEVMIAYSRMIRDGYPLDYLNVEYNIKEIKNKIKIIMDNAKKLQLGDSTIELKTILEYFNTLFGDFDKEKECKDLFKDNLKAFKFKLEKINKVVYDIYVQIDDIKFTYDLSDEEINKFSALNKNLEKINKDYKILVEQGRGKTFAYSQLVDELEGLNNKLSRLQEDLDYQLRSITSMKDDETRAKEELDTIQNYLKQAKYKLKDYKMPIIPSNYYIELKEAQDAIREIVKELDKKPIVIKILNIRVDTARDLVFKICNKTNDMIKEAQMSEKMIVYGNRYRSSYEDIDKGLDKATILFNKGLYKQSLQTTIETLKNIDSNIEEKIKLNPEN